MRSSQPRGLSTTTLGLPRKGWSLTKLQTRANNQKGGTPVLGHGDRGPKKQPLRHWFPRGFGPPVGPTKRAQGRAFSPLGLASWERAPCGLNNNKGSCNFPPKSFTLVFHIFVGSQLWFPSGPNRGASSNPS